ncbi:MAG: family 16 glycosylhydrolase [Phycisphaerae bacterium]
MIACTSALRLNSRVALLGGAAFVAAVPAVAQVEAGAPAGYTLVFEDDFNVAHPDTSFDPAAWSYDSLGPRRHAVNVRDAIDVTDGSLRIRTWTDAATGTHHTGMIRSRGAWEQGYFEAKIRFDTAPGMWSAFWLFNQDIWENQHAGPEQNGVEVDIIEHRARGFHQQDLSGTAHNALHWDGYGPEHKSAGHDTHGLGLGDGWHTYGVRWDDVGYVFYVNGVPVWDTSLSDGEPNDPRGIVSGIEQWMLLSSEVLNGSWAGDIPNGGFGDLTEDSPSMSVDWVRVYQVVPEPASGALAAGCCLLLGGRRRRPR